MNERIEIESEPLYLLHTHSLTGAHEWDRRSSLKCERKNKLWRSSFLFLGFTVANGAHSISEEVVGFSPLWFPRGKFFVSYLLCLLLCMLFSQIRS